ncbi:MAG: hypothetical protein Q4B26_15440 [Eubacteriales bacterium]|nr:hypothetical protein [Eubacteriales bacterium]
MLVMMSDYYNSYSDLCREKDWQKQERLDYCDQPLLKHGGRIRQRLASMISLLFAHRSPSF